MKLTFMKQIVEKGACREIHYFFDDPQVDAWSRSRDFPSHGLEKKL